MNTWYTTIFVVYTHCWCVAVVVSSVSLKRKKYTCNIFSSILCAHNCGVLYTRFHASNYGFYVVEENRYVKYFTVFLLCRGYTVGFITHSNEVRFSGKSALYYIISHPFYIHQPATRKKSVRQWMACFIVLWA